MNIRKYCEKKKALKDIGSKPLKYLYINIRLIQVYTSRKHLEYHGFGKEEQILSRMTAIMTI